MAVGLTIRQSEALDPMWTLNHRRQDGTPGIHIGQAHLILPAEGRLGNNRTEQTSCPDRSGPSEWRSEHSVRKAGIDITRRQHSIARERFPRMSQPPSPRQIASEWVRRVWSERDESAIRELMPPSARGPLEGGREIFGPEDFIDFYRTLLTVFPDLQLDVLDIVEDAEKAYVRWEACGTHRGGGWASPLPTRLARFAASPG